jgi:hypothetical protein
MALAVPPTKEEALAAHRVVVVLVVVKVGLTLPALSEGRMFQRAP